MIRELIDQDSTPYRDIRLESLRDNPNTFAISFEHESQSPDWFFTRRILAGGVYGAFVGEVMEGVAHLSVNYEKRTRHKAILGGVYVRPGQRGTGLAEELVNGVISLAGDRVELIHLSVALPNPRAVRFYERLGFTTYGVEARAMKIGTGYVDENLMVKVL